MEVKVTTDLSSEPIALAVAKNKIQATYGTDATEDAEINSLIKAARQMIEKYCNLSLGEKTIEILYHRDEVHDKRVKLPYGPHGDISEVVSIDQEGTETELELNSGYFKRGNQFKELEFKSMLANPFHESSGLTYDYKVTLSVGYGISETTEDLPEVFKQAIGLQVAKWYHHQFDGQLWEEVKKLINAYSRNIGI